MLTQQQRIEISKKIVSIPKQIQSAQQAKTLIQTVELPKAIELDNGNKSLIDQRQPMINGYQSELQMLDGNGRTVLIEQDYLDASTRVLGNKFFYNQPNIPTPSMPDGVWKNLLPFLGGYGVGKNYNEGYGPVQKEQDLIDAFNSAVTDFEAFHPMERCTGQRAVANPTPPPTDLIEPYLAVQTALTNLITAVNDYDAFLTSQSAVIYTSDTNLTRQIQSITAKSNIDTIIKPAIAAWLGYNNYNTSHGQTTSAGFYAYDTTLLAPTKGNPLQLDVLKTAVSTRKTFIDGTRRPQLELYLGNVTQNAGGDITAQSGLYGERALAIVLRLNTIGGSLAAIEGLNQAVLAQDNLIQSGNISSQAYDLAMKASKFIAPANSTKSIHVDNAGIFSVGDSVFVCGDGQVELSGTIEQIAGTRIDLDFEVPQKYTASNNSRIYKVI